MQGKSIFQKYFHFPIVKLVEMKARNVRAFIFREIFFEERLDVRMEKNLQKVEEQTHPDRRDE